MGTDEEGGSVTGPPDGLRALLLVTSLLLATFASPVALSEAVDADRGAAANVEIVGAIEYQESTAAEIDVGNDTSPDGGEVEVAWNDSAYGQSSGAVEWQVFVDGAVGPSGTTTVADGNLVIGDSVFGGDLVPGQEAVVAVTVSDGTGAYVHRNVTVQVTAGTLREGTNLTAYRGDPVAYATDDEGARFEIARNGSFYAIRDTGPNSHVFLVSTAEKDVGLDWTFVTDATSTTATLELEELRLTAFTLDTDLTAGDPITATLGPANVSREVTVRLVDVGDDTTVASQSVTMGVTPEVRFSNPGTGTYRIEVVDPQTGSNASALPISVEPVTGSVTLEESVRRQERGDVVELTFEFTGSADEARVTLGSAETVNYEVRFTVRDGNDDGRVVVRWNTARSAAVPDAGLSVDDGDTMTEIGPGDGNDSDDGDFLSLDDDESDGSSIPLGPPLGGDAFSSGPTIVSGATDPVEPAQYPVSVVTVLTGDETDVGTVVVEERSSNDLTTHTAPAGIQAFENVSALRRAISTADAGTTVAVDEHAQDWVVLRLEATGLDGVLDGASDFDDTGNHVTLTVTETDESVEPNGRPVTLRMGSNATFFERGEDDVYYLAFEASALLAEGAEAGDEFTATFVVGERNNVTSNRQTLSTNVTLVQGRSHFDGNRTGLFVEASESAELSGTSTWAPGTRLLVRIAGEGSPGAWDSQRDRVRVADVGSWTATFDLSDQNESRAFDSSLHHVASGALESTASGTVHELTATLEFEDQVASQAGTLVVVRSVTTNRGGFVAVHEGSPTGPVVGITPFLEAGTHRDVRVRLEEAVTAETTLVAVVHADGDRDRTFDFVVTGGAVDAPYSRNGTPVASTATVTFRCQLEHPLEWWATIERPPSEHRRVVSTRSSAAAGGCHANG